MNFDWKPRILVEVIAGSHCYGTAREESDVDIRGVLVPPADYFYGLSSFEQYEVPGCDSVYHELRRFLKLSTAGNPSFLEVWWAPYTMDFRARHKLSDFWRYTKQDLWPLVLSKKLLKPHLGMAKAHIARLEHGGKNCGEKGRETIAQFGWNTKDGAHVIRVLHQALELLATGRLTFPRPEAEDLRDIRNGRWTLAQVREAEADLVAQINTAADKSALREDADLKEINRWLVDMVPSMLDVLDGIGGVE